MKSGRRAGAGVRPTRPVESLALGNSDLLRMDMSQAARFWEVENPIARRDRKSGARKRKQSEIEDAIRAEA